MFKKKPFYLWCLTAAAALAVLAWHIYPRDMADLMVIPENISVDAMYWETERSCISQEWESGSPQAEQVWQLLHSTQYVHVPGLLLPLVNPDYLTRKYNSQQGAVILVLEDAEEEKYLVAFFREHMNYTPPDGMLKSYFVPVEGNIRDTLVELVVSGMEK